MQRDGTPAELVSALADGELRADEFAVALDWLATDRPGRVSWHAYQLIGDVLRAGPDMPGLNELAFSDRLGRLLLDEPGSGALHAATQWIADNEVLTGVPGPFHSDVRVANEASFEWKWLASAAALALFAVVGWQAWEGLSGQPGAGQVASATVPAASATLDPQRLASALGSEPAVMIRDPQLDALLAAHRQSGVASAFQTSTGFLRNATFEGAGR